MVVRPAITEAVAFVVAPVGLTRKYTAFTLQSAENDAFLPYSVPQADLIAYPFLVSECPFHHWLGLLHKHRRLPPPVH